MASPAIVNQTESLSLSQSHTRFYLNFERYLAIFYSFICNTLIAKTLRSLGLFILVR